MTTVSKMTPELWQRLKPLFHEALQVTPSRRSTFVHAACDGDHELENALERLLEAEQEGTGPIDIPLVAIGNRRYAWSARFEPGELVLGRFRIVRQIGKGGMGEVYDSEDLQLGRIALKTIRADLAGSPETFERFRQEVQLARRVSGRQVCRIHELYLLPADGRHDATAFLTMEYLDGTTLSSWVEKNGPFTWKEALRIASEICEGLRLIHENGIIHRDLKSVNIMLCEQEGDLRIVLMDFGLAHDFNAEVRAKQGSGGAGSRGRSSAPKILGTPESMAPEQFEGGEVSPATDIYALGVVLYELVTGVHPYAAETPVAAAIRRARPPRPPSSIRPGLPRQLDRVIDRCLQYDPERRFQTAGEVERALRAGPASLESLRSDRPWVLWLAAALVLVSLTAVGFLFWRSEQYYRPAPEALRWYDGGVAALREGNYVKATRSLQEAIAHDGHFAMAHARLAEAWADLDFDGNAQREMLMATPRARQLQPLDRMYLDAIHAMITRDHPEEIRIYRQILTRLPQAQRSAGYVDLGMAYERSTEPTHALESYAKAAALDGDNSASYLHTAVLQSRLNHVPEAERAFERAQALLSAEMNQEGMAELDYQRGYAANENGKLQEAKTSLDRALEEANAIASVQLQIRVLTQLSSAEYRTNAARAESFAEQAIRLARSSQLDAWAADGLVRLASARMMEGHLETAEEPLQEALQLARQTQQPRVEALANFTLASLMNLRHDPDEVIGPAQAALDYYTRTGRLIMAGNASLLLIRAERDKGQYAQAFEAGTAFLDVANKSGVHELIRNAHEVVGTVLIPMEQYPQALTHFESAYSLAETASDREYLAINAADALWKLGRYPECDAMLRFTPTNDKVAALMISERDGSLLSQGRFREVVALSDEVITRHPEMDADDRHIVLTKKLLARTHLGRSPQTLMELDAFDKESRTSDAAEESVRDLVLAEAELSSGMVEAAHRSAVEASTHFEASHQLDSELRSVCLAAAAAKGLKLSTEYNLYATKAVDILSQIKQTWGPQAFQSYVSRPDLQLLLRQIQISSEGR